MGTKGRKRGIITWVTYTCEQCQKIITCRKGSQGRGRFCSVQCAGKYNASLPRKSADERAGLVKVDCAGCEQPFYKWKNDAARVKAHNFHDRKCRALYYALHVSDLDKLRDMVWERDGGQCVTCGSIRFTEVHHKNGNHSDNRMDNLVLLCKKCHVAAHIDLNGGYLSNGSRSKALTRKR